MTGLYVLIIYMLALLILSWYAGRQTETNIQDYTTASNSLGVFVLTLTFSATYHSAYAFLGAPGFVYANGIGWWVNGIWTVFPGVLFWVWGRRFWFLGKKYGYISVSQYISDIYNSDLLGLLVTIISLIFTFPYVAMQAIGSGYIFETISGGTLSYAAGTLIFFAIMIILVWMGGMKGVAWTDAAQGVFMYVGMVVGAYLVVTKNFGSIPGAFRESFKVDPTLFYLPGPKGVITYTDWISRWTIITIGMMMFPHIVLRFFAGKSLRVLKWSSVFSSIYLTTLYVFIPAVGFGGRVLFPDYPYPDNLFPVMLLKYTPILFASLIICGALAASMSTGDSQLHAISTLVSTDVYKKYINPGADAHKLYSVAKILVVIFGVISIIIALQRPGLLGNILAVANGGVAVLAPAMIGGLYWKHATKQGALWSIILGELVLVITTFIIPSPFKIMPGLWGLMMALVVFLVVSQVTVPDEKTAKIIDSMNEFFGDKKAKLNA